MQKTVNFVSSKNETVSSICFGEIDLKILKSDCLRAFSSTILDKTFQDFFHFLAQFDFTTSETEQDY